MKKLSVSLSKKEIIFGILYILLQLLVLPSLLTWGNRLLGSPFSAAELNFIFFALNFTVITVAFRRFLLHNLKVGFGNLWIVFRYAGAGLVFYWLSSILVGILISLMHPSFSNANDESIFQLSQDNFMLISIGTVFLVPVVEETLYRGVIFGSLYQKSPLAAYVLSTVLFSAIHILGYLGAYTPLELFLSFLQYVPAGIFLAWSYASSDCIWAPVFIHIAVNQVSNLSMR